MKQPRNVTKKDEPKNQRSFSVELKSKADLKAISMSSDGYESILIEGSIGEFSRAEFTEGVILEIAGSRGILRVDLKENEIRKTKEEQYARD